MDKYDWSKFAINFDYNHFGVEEKDSDLLKVVPGYDGTYTKELAGTTHENLPYRDVERANHRHFVVCREVFEAEISINRTLSLSFFLQTPAQMVN
jgi:hypothetical protein